MSLTCFNGRRFGVGRLILDLMNEPDVFGMKWEAPTTFADTKLPPVTDLYLPTMRVLPFPF
jgi:hypothetical protein